MLSEGLRADSLYVGSIRISQLVGFVTFIVGAVLLTVYLRRVRKTSVNNTDEEMKTSEVENDG